MMKKKKPRASIHVPYVYYFLLAHKDDLLVPLMRGAANVSLNLDRLRALRIPLPEDVEDQKRHVEDLERKAKDLVRARLTVSEAEKAFEQSFTGFRNRT
jgi:hypothetical protein